MAHEAFVGEMENAFRIFVGKADGNNPVGRTRSVWKQNI
jgi:hypothetical protein